VALAEERKSVGRERTLAFVRMCAWVDKLDAMPTVQEMSDHCAPPFGMADLDSLIETREYRGLKKLE
jgi:hypothetical protein